MTFKVLLTGAGGYIGGSFISDLVLSEHRVVEKENLIAVLRSPTNAQQLIEQGINAVNVDLTDDAAVRKIILDNNVDAVLHTASSHEPEIAASLISALGELRKASGNPKYFIHTAGTTGYVAESGWSSTTPISDLDDVYEVERTSSEYPIRKTDLRVIEEGEKHDVTTFIVVVPSVYGKGTGIGKTVSIAIPAFVRAALKTSLVHMFEQDGQPASVHISDLQSFYGLLLKSISTHADIPSGRNGYYFPIGHFGSVQATMKRLAKELYSLNLVREPEAKLWESDEEAGAAFDLPPFIARVMGTHRVQLQPKKAASVLGWQPKWTAEMCLDNIRDDVLHYLEVESPETLKATK